MTGWAPKRFWTEVSVVEDGEGFCVALDSRPIKTPAKSLLRVPTRQLADDVASEWRAQGDLVDPRTMPVTRTANSAIDKVTPQRAEVVQMLADYADADLLCYRADSPRGLTDRQAAAWDPLLDWADAALGIRLKPVAGVMHAAQDPAALSTAYQQVNALSDFQLAGFHDLVTLPGSLIIAFAIVHKTATPEDLWQVARLDELWQIQLWGKDDEAEEVNALKLKDFQHAARFFHSATEIGDAAVKC
ncbi:MAG: ATP12 family protein [Pseudomonadota bacterium]